MKQRICLNCGLQSCLCEMRGQTSKWLEVAPPKLPAPRLFTHTVEEMFTIERAYTLANIVRCGRISEYNRITLEALLLPMGYDNEQQTAIISKIEAEGLALRGAPVGLTAEFLPSSLPDIVTEDVLIAAGYRKKERVLR